MPTALITGGTAGLGAAFARALAGRGDDLVLVARDADRLAAIAADLEQRAGVQVEVLVADLAVESDLQRVADRLEDPEHPVSLLVNNAGFGVPDSLVSTDLTGHRRALDVMCWAVLVLGAAAGRAMRERGGGTIINVSSLASWIVQGHYSPIKAWVRNYSEGLAGELAGTGVTVSALCPGWIRTEFHERARIPTRGIPDRVWVDADRVAVAALADAERGVVISVPTLRWKLTRAVVALSPRPLVRWGSGILTRSRR